jgi:release factor glutamine methyltransferase
MAGNKAAICYSMPALAPLLQQLTAALAKNGHNLARLECELLAAHVLGISRQELVLNLSHLSLSQTQQADLQALLARRMAHEPIAYLLGSREFWSLSFKTPPGVLIPRPDSETLVEAALKHAQAHDVQNVLDLGVGSGCLLLSILHELPNATGIGIDISPVAVATAKANAQSLGLAARTRIMLGSWTQDIIQTFDIIVSNPPYIALDEQASLPPDVRDYEPSSALFAGADGLEAYRTLLPQLPKRLRPQGIILLEIGATQADSISALAHAQGLHCRVIPDLAGLPRVVMCAFEPDVLC